MLAALPWNAVGEPSAVRASARSVANAASVSGEAAASSSASTSSPGTRSSAAAMPSGLSRSSVVVNWATWSARKTDHSRSGSVSRAATTARHIGHVPCTCGRGRVANGMPRRRNVR